MAEKPFDSARLTLARAHHHIDDLKAQINTFIENKPWSYVVDPKPDSFEETHKIRFTRRIDPAILDKKISCRRIGTHLPPKILALFRSFNPHEGGNNSLWAMNKLCNAQKHCILIPTAIGNASASFSGKVQTVKGALMMIAGLRDIGWDTEKNEIILFSGGGPGFQTLQSDIAPHVTIEITIKSGDIKSGKTAVGVLDGMSGIVECVLLATEAECRSLGFQVD